jgi:activating signal cointegrator 1
MRCISLWQPWSTLIAIEAKHYETRSWGTSYRGDIVIHAAKTRDELYACYAEPFKSVLKAAGLHAVDIPVGAALCIAKLTDCIRMTPEFIDAMTPQERAFGDWKPGRFAWKLEDIRPFAQPIKMRGAQGLFDCQLPQDVTP